MLPDLAFSRRRHHQHQRQTNTHTHTTTTTATTNTTKQFDVQSYSAAFNDGKATRVTYAVPPSYSAPSAAPPSPQDLQAKVYGNEVQVRRCRVMIMVL